MDRQMIYCQLTAAGMTPAGAAGLMGNMQCESGMRANNAQDCYGRDDVQYTELTALIAETYSNV